MKTSEQRMQAIRQRADERRIKRKKGIRIAVAAATSMSLVLAFALVLFVPYSTALPDLSAYRGSEYYSLMQQLNALTYTPSAYHNNFEAWFGDALNKTEDGDMGATTPESPATDSGDTEVTDNQVAGVLEGDLFKRTDSHIFYLCADSTNTRILLFSYSIDGAQSEQTGLLSISPDDGTYFYMYADYYPEFYLDEDGGTVTIFVPVWVNEHGQMYTAVISVDVSDPAGMCETGRLYVSGNYVSSRMVDGDFLLISNFGVRRNPDFGDEAQFLPQVGVPGALESLPMSGIICPDTASTARYTVIVRLGEGLRVEGQLAFLSSSQEVYVSQENIFVTRGYTANTQTDGYEVRTARTQISCVSYAGEGLALSGSADVAGSVLDQYSMDEADGMLRVVTTLSSSAVRTSTAGGDAGAQIVSAQENAALYVIDLADFSLRASLENFAPEGEEVTSVRFDADLAWVCTARVVELTDPVFRIDLSDLDEITWTDTGTIEGYSTSLVDFTDGTLLGIGYSEDLGLKVEVYDRDGNSVVSVAVYERSTASFSRQYKAYYIDRENGLVGLHVYDWSGKFNSYVLLHFNGYELKEVCALALTSNAPDLTRATIVDGWLYVLSPHDNMAVWQLSAQEAPAA